MRSPHSGRRKRGIQSSCGEAAPVASGTGTVMANLPSLEPLKQTYRTRYRGNPSEDLPYLRPGENVLALINNYLNLRHTNSDSEDSVIIEPSRHARVTVRSRIQQSKENEAKDSPTRSRINDTPRYSQGNGHLTTSRDAPTIPNALKMNARQPESSDDLFSDEESDNEKTYMVAKLIEESLAEDEDEVDHKLVKNSKEHAKQLYSSNISVLQQPPSPTSNVHAKKWLRFNDSALPANDSAFSHTLSRISGKFTDNAKQLKRQNTVYSNKKPDSADMTYDLYTETNGPDDEFVIEEESGKDMQFWVNPLKKKKAPPLSTRPKEDIPKKTNTSEAPSSLKRKSENVKALLNTNATPKRLEDVLVTEGESSSSRTSLQKKRASLLSTRSKDDKPGTTPTKANSLEALSSVKKKLEKVKESLPTSSPTSGRPEDEFVIEEGSNCEWISPFKMKKVSPSTRSKEDKPATTPKKTISSETPSSLKTKSENVNSNTTAERLVNTEKTKDCKTGKRSLSSIFFKIAAAGLQGDRQTGLPVVSKASNNLTAAANTEDEFEIEDLSEMNKSNLLINPIKTKSRQIGHVGKREKSVLQLQKNVEDDNSESECTVIKLNRNQDFTSIKIDNTIAEQIHSAKNVTIVYSNASTSNDTVADVPQEPALLQVEGIEQQGPLSQDTSSHSVVEGIGKQVPSCQDADLKRDIEVIESVGSVNRDVVPGENQEDYSDHVENGTLSPTKQMQQIRSSPRRDSDYMFDDLEETFTIRIRKGKVAAKNTKPKPPEEQQDEPLAKEKKTQKNVAKKKSERQKSNKQRQSSKARNESAPAEACMSDEVLEKCASKKEAMKESVEATPCGQSHNGNLEIDNFDEQPVTEVYLPKKRKSKMKNIITPCPADHSNEDSVFQSGPVVRQRAVAFAEPVEPLAINLDYLEEHEELLKRYMIVFDPDTKSDALVECIAQSESSEFVGNDHCSYWNSFNNGIFTSGKLKIAPRRKSEMHNSMYKIMIYYVEQGVVQVNLYRSERILKNGDFFFIPPGNICTLTNLQDEDALLVFSILNIFPAFTEG